MFQPPYRMDYEALFEKILSDDGLLNDKDRIFTQGLNFRYELIEWKVNEFYLQRGATIKHAKQQRWANVLLIDPVYMRREPLNNPILSFAIVHNHRIVSFSKFSERIHSELLMIDKEMYENLLSMVKSKDPDSLIMACGIMSTANRTDPTSIKYLIKLSHHFNASFIGGVKKEELYHKDPTIYELFDYLEREYNDEYEMYRYDSDDE